eukprot:TRINITY_DN813_c0_g1_i1.p1 TRINITY_DN813_c0_g1~~TRINITY_DN813_c0_g1_i1.p1  ORF type:complete len:122 (+),score=10.15 TRINITY_DN813_c0_g1_i1:282-647(+)
MWVSPTNAHKTFEQKMLDQRTNAIQKACARGQTVANPTSLSAEALIKRHFSVLGINVTLQFLLFCGAHECRSTYFAQDGSLSGLVSLELTMPTLFLGLLFQVSLTFLLRTATVSRRHVGIN